MTPDEARKLLGGYATGTLTSEEREALFAAALEDQSLFDELAQEQVLKEALDDSGIRADLLDAVSTRSRKSWMRWWPVPAGALALAALTVVLLLNRKPVMPDVAMVTPPAAQPQIVAAPAPVPMQALKMKPERTVSDRVAPATSMPKMARLDGALERRAKEAEPSNQAPATAAPGGPPPAAAPPPAPAQAEPQKAVGRAVIASAPSVMADANASPASSKAAAPAASNAQMLFEGSGPLGASGGQAGMFRAQAVRAQEAVASLKKAEDRARIFPGPGVKYSLVAGGIAAEPNLTGFLQGFRRGASGEWIDSGAGPQPVKAHVPLTLKFGPGEMVLVLSAEALPSLAAGGAEVDRLLASSRILTGVNGGTHFAVNPNPAADAILAVRVEPQK